MCVFNSTYAEIHSKYVLIFIITGTVALYFVYDNLQIARDMLLATWPSVKRKIDSSHNEWSSIFECPLPEIDPWEPQDANYVGKPPNNLTECKDTKNATSKLENGKLWITLTGTGNVNCSYRCLNYKNDSDADLGAWTLYVVPGPATVTCDWVDVLCKNGENTEYRQVHSQIYAPAPTNTTKKRYNVYILGLDAISHGQFHRTMPKTVYFLENELDGINFKHLSKVGYNSVPNQMAALFGQRFTTVRHAPQGYPTFNMSDPYFCKRAHSKDEQYIGFIYNDLGFRTAHIDDMLPLVQGYPNCQGFGFADTNHSTVPLLAQMKEEEFKKTVLSDSCKEQFQLSVEFFEAYMKAKTPEGKFAFTMLTGPGHNKLDDPYKYDDYFYHWLKKIRNDIDDAFLLVWSDHGHHFGPFYPTVNGQTDTRNPLLTVVLPKDLRSNPSHLAVENLRKNAQTLVSQYDMFPTLVDLATVDFDSPDSFTKHLTLQDFTKLNHRIQEVHGDSLLRPLTHRTPTCAGLGIPFIFCLCRWPIFAPEDESHLKQVVINSLPSVLNAYIKSIGAEDVCEKFEVNENRTVEVYEVATKLLNPTSRMIRTKFSITAFNGIQPFHVQVFFELTTNGTISLAGRIHRYDTAWASGLCRIDEYEQHFCYCK